MTTGKQISGFSKLTASQKRDWLRAAFKVSDDAVEELEKHLHSDPAIQEIYEEFSENTISNFFIPYGIAPNFLINGKMYAVPMAIEESSVVAAASHAAKFWSAFGGFRAEIADTLKVGQVHLFWSGSPTDMERHIATQKTNYLKALSSHTASMEKRGGGIVSLELKNNTHQLENFYQLHLEFRTGEAMGANFINTVLEALAAEVKSSVADSGMKGDLEINMSILSNYTPESRVKIGVKCPVEALGNFDPQLDGSQFAEKFVRAVNVAKTDPHRAVTHNKGIFNGMDGVVIATGNDFRAVEACGHAYASKDGSYSSLSTASVKKGMFKFELDIPMAVGTVGGLTRGHPLAKISMAILEEPSAEELMMIIAAAGLANNFSAVRSLITSGIQKGHMKMHLSNILRQLNASESQKENATRYFENKTVSYSAVKAFLETQTS